MRYLKVSPHKAGSGFTLVELMVVAAIISILAAIAYPAYTESTRKSRRTDAQGGLMGLASALERHYTQNNSYLAAAAGGADTGAPAIYHTETPTDGSTKFYDLTIAAATATTFTVRATPKNAQAGDGFMELTSTGIRRWDKNNNGNATEAGEDSWTK